MPYAGVGAASRLRYVTRCYIGRGLAAAQGRQLACTLANLSEEDKAKVAKLIHQVVDMEKELHERRNQEQVCTATPVGGQRYCIPVAD